ncbi:MAG: GNAT family N-acetyltransferase [Burkholderiales bacterium]
MQADDLVRVKQIQDSVYPGIGGWRIEQLESQLRIFPQGQLVACIGESVVGAASSLIVKWDTYGTSHSYKEVTGAGFFTTHDPSGRTLYGAEVFSDPESRRQGIGKALYQARRRICRAMNLRRIMACGRMPSYEKVAGKMPPEEYATRVIWGDLQDPVLLFQLREGFHWCGVVRDYMPSDTESCGHATIIVWLNERYRADRPTAIPEGPIL